MPINTLIERKFYLLTIIKSCYINTLNYFKFWQIIFIWGILMYNKIDISNEQTNETSQEESSEDSSILVKQGSCQTKLESEGLAIGTRGLGPCIAIIATGMQYNDEDKVDHFITLYHWESLVTDFIRINEAIPATEEPCFLPCVTAMRDNLIQNFFKEVLINAEGEDAPKVKITNIALVGGQKRYKKNGELIIDGVEIEALAFKKIFNEKDELEKLKTEIDTNFQTSIDFFELTLNTTHLLVAQDEEFLDLQAEFNVENNQLILNVTKGVGSPQNSPQKTLVSPLSSPEKKLPAQRRLILQEKSLNPTIETNLSSPKTLQFFKRSFDENQIIEEGLKQIKKIKVEEPSNHNYNSVFT
jgi:hypothetical protein